MRSRIAAFAITLALLFARVSRAQDSGAFVVRLGQDTTAFERFTQTKAGVQVDQVGRSPRVMRRHVVYGMRADGSVESFSYVVRGASDPADAAPVQQINATFSSDSMRMDLRRGDNLQSVRAAIPRGTVLLAGTSPWEMYELLSMRLVASKADSLRRPAFYVGGDTLYWVSVARLGRDSVRIQNAFDGYRARIDKTGHLLHLVPVHGTAQFSVDRIASVDLEAQTASFVAAEKRAGEMGVLSTRDTITTNAGGAALWIDYGRPMKRGREIWGALVPWSVVWRTGANAATQFKTDHALDMNGTRVPAGFYTLWSIPTQDGMKLVINGQTGQWGTEHNPAKDLYTIAMQVSALAPPVDRFTISVDPGDRGGVLRLEWDNRRASLPFTTVQ